MSTFLMHFGVSTHPFTMPEDDELRTLVATHISGTNVSSSPGFDTIKPIH